jgi:hypothetical protein
VFKWGVCRSLTEVALDDLDPDSVLSIHTYTCLAVERASLELSVPQVRRVILPESDEKLTSA